MIIKQATDLHWTEVSHNPDIKKQVLLANGEISNLTQFAHSIFKPGQIAPAHSHDDMTETFLVTSGTLTAEVDGSIYTLTAGSFITLQPGEIHELRNESTADLHLTYFGILTK